MLPDEESTMLTRLKRVTEVFGHRWLTVRQKIERK